MTDPAKRTSILATAINDEIAHIEGRLKDVAEKWEYGKPARTS
jgi:hypothetical protein